MSDQKPVPSPKGQFLLGHMTQFKEDILAFNRRMVKEYPEIVHVKLGPLPIYHVYDPDLIREVLVKQAANFPKADIGLHIMSKGLGNGLVTSEGDFHKKQRKLMQPAFHHKRVQAYGEIMVDYTQRHLANWRDGQTRDINNEMMRLTMFIVAKALFDSDMGEVGGVTVAAHAIASNQEWMEKEFWLGFKMPAWIPTRGNRTIKQNNQDLAAVLQPIIDERRVDGRIEDKGDLLSMLLIAAEEEDMQLSDQQLMDEVVTLFSAGHETTSNALTWALYLLSQHPEAAEKLKQELDTILNGRLPTMADLPNLTYTEMVLKEAMRLLPPVWSLIFRQAQEDANIGGYPIPKGGSVVISPYATHRLEKYFPNPEQFDPERFHPNHEADIPRYAYLPFGAGPHVCIGAQFAMMEAKLILSILCQRFHFELHPDQEVEPEPLVTMGPKHGMRMTLKAHQ